MASFSDDDVRKRFGLAPETPVRRHGGGGAPEAARYSSDAFHVVELTSALDGSRWERPVAVAGSAITLTVQGTFVGEGAPTAAIVRDARGRTLGQGRAVMHADRAFVEVTLDRTAARSSPDGILSAADVEIRDLGLKAVSAPLLVLPFAELDDAAWDLADAREGDVATLSCALRGSAAGVERAGREPVDIEILRGASGEDAVFEPITTLRGAFARGRLTAKWRVGYDAEGKARIATQPELDQAAERTGAPAGQYARPTYRFRVRVAGLKAESPDLLYRDHVDLAWDADTDRPASGAAVTVALADGTTLETELGEDGRQRLGDVPPGPVTAEFGPDPRIWQPRPELLSPGALPAPAPLSSNVVAPPEAPILIASAGDLDPALLASIAGFGPDDDDESFIEWLWDTMKGDFNEDATYDQIATNIGASFVPVVGQIMDIRDVFAGLYLLTKDRGWQDWLKWLALFVTLVGIIPVLGDAVKGVFRVALRSIKNSTLRGYNAAADALEASGALDVVFQKAKAALQKAKFDDLDHVPNVATWIRDLDLSWITDWARWGLDTLTARVKSTFEWAAESAERGVLRLGEALATRLEGVRMFLGDTVRNVFTLRRQPPRVAVPTPSLAAKLRGVSAKMDELQASANAQVEQSLRMLDSKLRELVGVPPRQRAAGVTGGEVHPEGSTSGARRAADEALEARRLLAERFYRDRGFSESDIVKHTRGIDYNHPVEVVSVEVGDRIRTYQGRRAWQGQYYFRGIEPPTRLGIGPISEDGSTGEMLVKEVFEYEVVTEIQGLRSTAAAILDDWSAPSKPFPSLGGAIQTFIADKSSLRILP